MKKAARNAEAGPIAGAIWAVLLVGVVASVAAGITAGARQLVGVALGATIAAINLWAVSRIVRAFTIPGEPRLPWALIATAKFSVLFGAVIALVDLGITDLISLLIGYGALPIGIVASQLRSAPAVRGEG